jgi:hypothetical protein
MNTVTETIDQLANKAITIDEAVRWFGKAHWPCPTDMRKSLRARDAAGEVEPEPEGGFAEVQAAYFARRISAEEYDKLAAAAAAAMHSAQVCPS